MVKLHHIKKKIDNAKHIRLRSNHLHYFCYQKNFAINKNSDNICNLAIQLSK